MTNIKKSHQLLGTFLVITSGLLYGMIGYFGMKLFAQGYSVPSMLFWRFTVATLWMLGASAIMRRKRSIQLSKAKTKLMLKLATVGSISYAGGSAFFYLASLYIGTGPGMVIFFSFPVYVVLFSLYFGRARLNAYMLISLLMVVSGLVLLNGTGGNNLNNTGILLAMIAAFSYGVYVYYSQESAKHADSLWLTLFICAGCSLIFLVFALLTHTFAIPATTQAWRDILILGIVATAIPIQLLLNGLKYISSVKASIYSVMEPLTTVVVGVLFLQESLSAMQIAGIIIILSGAITIQFEKQPEINMDVPLK
jgi:drug/metabolite transporter (DMT)-like permease